MNNRIGNIFVGAVAVAIGAGFVCFLLGLISSQAEAIHFGKLGSLIGLGVGAVYGIFRKP